MSKELEEALVGIPISFDLVDAPKVMQNVELIKSALKRKEKLELAIRDLFASHIDFVVENDKCYFKIKNSKGKEKSFTSKTFESFWKEVLEK